MLLIVDNYDSFVNTLSSYFLEEGVDVVMARSDAIDAPAVLESIRYGGIDGVVLSPGPGTPRQSGNCSRILMTAAGLVPVLGVCLGHQIIAHSFGASVVHGEKPMHGKITSISNNGAGIFSRLPESFSVTRYHSLVVDETTLPDPLMVTARDERGVVMAVQHRELPIFGVQFHPEAVLTEYGHQLIGNFVDICTGRLQSGDEPAYATGIDVARTGKSTVLLEGVMPCRR